MKKPLSFIFIFLCFLLSLTACQNNETPASEPAEPPMETTQPEPAAPPEPEKDSELPQREKDWMEDIEFLRTEYKKRHLDPFYLCTEEEFDWKLDQLLKKTNNLSDSDIYFEISVILAGMGDVHTAALEPAYVLDETLAVGVRYFGERLYLYGYQKGYEQFEPYLMQEVVAINGIDIAYLRKKAESVLDPHNVWHTKENAVFLYRLPAFLDWAGCDYQEGYTFQILNANQEVESIPVPVVSSKDLDPGEWVVAENLKTISYLKGGNWASYCHGENGGFVYMVFSDLDETSIVLYQNLFQETVQLINAHPDCGKLVIDLRNHGGGRAYLLDFLREIVGEMKTPWMEQVYVVTSGTTMSAAISCIEMFQMELDAIVIGEPTGQFTSFFGYSFMEPIVLPHSQIHVNFGNYWHQGASSEETYDENGRLYPWENTILPDVYIYQDIEDIRQGKDSVLEWVLKQ